MNKVLSMISKALSSNSIGKFEAIKLRSELGIGQGHFTRNRISKAKRKAHRKMQQRSRRINRNHCKRGQKRSGR